MPDLIINGQPQGSVANALMEHDFDTGLFRPWTDPRTGLSYVAVKNAAGEVEVKQVHNANATLRKDEWIQLDRVVVEAARQRMRIVRDMRGAGLVYTLPNGMASTVLQTQNQSDIEGATVSMDGLSEGERDRPQYDLTNLPLPIVHKDFSFSTREIAASRRSGSPLDTTNAGLAATRVAEEIEQMTLGDSTYAAGGGNIYGFKNFPQRITKTITDPTGAWTPQTLVTEILEMRTLSQQAKHYGPWRLYFGLAWDPYLDADYSDNKGDNTLRDRLRSITGITGVDTADFLTGFDVIMVQQSVDVARMVVGMDITTLQWESHGGMKQNFKVMAIMVPQLRSDFNNNTGLVHATV